MSEWGKVDGDAFAQRFHGRQLEVLKKLKEAMEMQESTLTKKLVKARENLERAKSEVK